MSSVWRYMRCIRFCDWRQDKWYCLLKHHIVCSMWNCVQISRVINLSGTWYFYRFTGIYINVFTFSFGHLPNFWQHKKLSYYPHTVIGTLFYVFLFPSLFGNTYRHVIFYVSFVWDLSFYSLINDCLIEYFFDTKHFRWMS